MDHAIVPDALAGQFEGLTSPTELRDPSGHLLGVFTPANRRLPGEPEDTLEELRAIVAEPGGSTLEEIWREFGAK